MSDRPKFLERASDPVLYESWVAEELALIAKSDADAFYLNDCLAHRDLRVVMAAFAHPNFPKAARRDLARDAFAQMSKLDAQSLTAMWSLVNSRARELTDTLILSNNPSAIQDPWYAKPFGSIGPEFLLSALTRCPNLSPNLLDQLLNHSFCQQRNSLKLINVLDMDPPNSVRLDILQYYLTTPTLISDPLAVTRCQLNLLSRPGVSDALFTDALLDVAKTTPNVVKVAELNNRLTRLHALPKEEWVRLIGSSNKELRLFAIKEFQNSRPNSLKI